MTSLTDLLQQGTAHAWLFVPSAILLGALHGLEPGHSKTMMAAFIIAVRGTVTQAVLLGLAATLSHTAVVWIIALGGQYLELLAGSGAARRRSRTSNLPRRSSSSGSRSGWLGGRGASSTTSTITTARRGSSRPRPAC